MQFSEYERRILAELEREISTEDPGLAEMFRTGQTHHDPLSLRTLIFSVLPGALLFALALLTQSPALLLTALMVTSLSFSATALWMWASNWPKL